MAKFTTVGYVAAKKADKNSVYVKIENDVKLKKGQFLNVQKKPTDEDIANSKSERQAEVLAKKAENWPDWKLSELVLVENDSE